MRRFPFLLLACFALLPLAPAAHAEDPPPGAPKPAQDPEATLVDYLGVLQEMQDRLGYFVQSARWPGHDGALAYIWRVHVQKRAKRAQRFYRELTKPTRWVIDEETEWALHLRQESWSPFIQRLAKAYSELAAARDGLRRINVSPRSAISNWHKQNPEPDLRRSTPAERALAEVRAAIASYRRAGKAVPRWYYVREAELIEEALAERRALEAAHAAWIVARKQAIQQIHASVEETKQVAASERERIEQFLRATQSLVADLQLHSEHELRQELAAVEGDEQLAREAKKDFKDMAKGRKAGATYSTAKSSRWSSYVRQGWMRPYKHLISAIKRAKTRAERAAKAAEEASGKPDEPGKSPEGGG